MGKKFLNLFTKGGEIFITHSFFCFRWTTKIADSQKRVLIETPTGERLTCITLAEGFAAPFLVLVEEKAGSMFVFAHALVISPNEVEALDDNLSTLAAFFSDGEKIYGRKN